LGPQGAKHDPAASKLHSNSLKANQMIGIRKGHPMGGPSLISTVLV
jgi:hypothetical protein